jgi:hypothetical protein
MKQEWWAMAMSQLKLKTKLQPAPLPSPPTYLKFICLKKSITYPPLPLSSSWSATQPDGFRNGRKKQLITTLERQQNTLISANHAKNKKWEFSSTLGQNHQIMEPWNKAADHDFRSTQNTVPLGQVNGEASNENGMKIEDRPETLREKM